MLLDPRHGRRSHPQGSGQPAPGGRAPSNLTIVHGERSVDRAVDSALEWLTAHQRPTGELPSFASALGSGSEEWTPDTLNFITALVALALDEIDDPRAVGIVDRSVRFLRSELERGDLWRYWARTSDQHDYTPPDADDTACCSMAVARRGIGTKRNVALLLDNRDERGRFRTWFVHHRSSSLQFRWATREEWLPRVRRRRAELWANSEAEPDDVDGVVNANVLRYLGPELAPVEAIEWVVELVEAGLEGRCDKWHRNPTTAWAAIADGSRTGITGFRSLAPVVVRRILDRLDSSEPFGPALDTGQALVALRSFSAATEVPRSAIELMAEQLVNSQRPDGSWSRSVFYFGGPDEVFGWAAEALSTAVAVRALAGRTD